ncbi:MAG: hypothetical protein RLZZ519_3043, partial [Bacteroidota bacterium]
VEVCLGEFVLTAGSMRVSCRSGERLRANFAVYVQGHGWCRVFAAAIVFLGIWIIVGAQRIHAAFLLASGEENG